MILTAAVTAVLMVLSSVVASGPALAQADGLDVSSVTTYTPDPEAEVVDVYATFTMTNQQADEVVDGSARSYFYTRWVIALPATVTNFEATSSGQELTTTIEPTDEAADDVVFGSIALPFDLKFGQTVTIDVNYTIPGGDPRAEVAIARVNESFLSFSVWVSGDSGQTDVRIDIPDGFTMDLQGDLDELQRVSRDGQSFLEAIAIDEPKDFFGRVFGRNDGGLITETATLPDATATVRAWPDDPEWVEFVVDAIETDVPIIEELTGLAWPAGDIEVIETVTPYLYGYGGWFNASSGQIEVGENLERDLILHELGHAWFNDELIEGRWITEGLAEEYASRTIEASGDERPDPTEPDLSDPLRVPLAAWASPWTLNEEDAFAYEQYHYNASWWVMRQISEQIGLDAFAQVLISLNNDELAYRGDGPIEQTQVPTRWTHLFDLLEAQAGATELDELFRTHVLTEIDAARLPQRRETLGAYVSMLDAADSWGAPLVVRRALSAWRFEDATTLLEVSAETLAARDQVDSLAAELNVTISRNTEAMFESAISEQDLRSAHEAEAALADELGELRQRRTELADLANMLDIRIDHPSMTYQEAFADVIAQRTGVEGLAARRGQVETRAAELRLLAPPWLSADSATDIASEIALADARLATLDAIEAATAAVDAPRSRHQRVGVILNDPADALNEARDAFEADALDRSLVASSRADALIADASDVGRRRIVVAASAVALIIGAIVATRLLRRQRNKL